MSEKKVVVCEHLDRAALEWLAERVRVVSMASRDADSLRRELADADGLIVRTYTRVDEALLAHAPQLQVVGRAGVGLDNFDLAACRQRDVTVVYTPDANTQAVVEYVTALLLDALRPRPRLAAESTDANFHEHRATAVGVELASLTVGVLGVGRIGRRVARVLAALGARVVCRDLLPVAALDLGADFPGVFVDEPRFWEDSDVVTLHVDGRPQNQHLLNAAVLGALRPHALIINAARGMLIDPIALRQWALASAAAGGRAILDVHEPEPPPAEHPLRGLANVELLPHLGARTDRALARMSWVVRDVYGVLQGEPAECPAP